MQPAGSNACHAIPLLLLPSPLPRTTTTTTSHQQPHCSPPAAVQFTLVGKIKSVNENATRMTIHLEDSTGNIEIMYWIPQEDSNFVSGTEGAHMACWH